MPEIVESVEPPKRRMGRITLRDLIGKQGAQQLQAGQLIEQAYSQQTARVKARQRQEDEDLLMMY
jgi:hypothetical protein